MICPKCSADTTVLDIRERDDGATLRRRRRCLDCEHRFTTYEREAREEPWFTVRTDGRVDPNNSRIARELVEGYAALSVADRALLVVVMRRLRESAA